MMPHGSIMLPTHDHVRRLAATRLAAGRKPSIVQYLRLSLLAGALSASTGLAQAGELTPPPVFADSVDVLPRHANHVGTYPGPTSAWSATAAHEPTTEPRPVGPELVPSPAPDVNVGRVDLATLADVDAPTDKQRIGTVEKTLKDLDKKFKDALASAKKDEFPSARLTGFTQLDTAYYHQDRLNMATVGNAQDGTGFRRARLAVKGKVAEFTDYQLEMDFATAGRPSFFDNYIDQSNLPWLGTVRVGQFCQPFSVDALTGFRNLTFLERDLAFLTFVPFRRVGVMAYSSTEDRMTNWAYSVYRTGGFNNAPLGDDRFATDFGDVGGYSFSGRVTHLLHYDEQANDRYLWHVGGAYNFSKIGANTAAGSGTLGNAGGGNLPFYQCRTLPEFGTLGYPENNSTFGSAVNGTPSFVDSGRYAATSFNLYGVETVYQAGPWAAQAEFMATQVDSYYGSVFYHGAYGQIAWKPTGEHRVYDKQLGTLGKVVPYTDFISLRQGQRGRIAGWGAWELGARWSYVSVLNPAFLNGHYLNNTSNAGTGILNEPTLGVTWFLNTHTKLQFNWIHPMLDNTVRGYSQADLFVGRAQVDF